MPVPAAVPVSTHASIPGQSYPGHMGVRAGDNQRTALRQCDATASGAENSLVRLGKGLLMLDLCGHHFAELELALLAAGWQVTDDNRG